MSKRVILLVGTSKGAFFFQTDEERRKWRMTGPHLGGWEIYGIRGDERHGPRVFAGTSHAAYGPALRVSEDMGESWRQVESGPAYAPESGFELKRIWQIVPGHESEPDTLFAGVDEAGLFVSRDRGESWQELAGLTSHPTRPSWAPGAGGMCLHTILIHPDNPKRMWVAMSAVGVFRSEDGGQTWRARNQGLQRVPTGEAHPEVGFCIHKMVLDPDDPDTLYMQEHGGVFKSVDGGDSWSFYEEGLPADRLVQYDAPFGFPIGISRTGDQFIVPLESSEQRTVKGGKLLVYRRERGGDSWRPVGDVVPDEPRHVSVLRDALCVDELEPYGTYFGTTSGEVFYSLDRGVNWDKLPGQLSRILNVKAWALED